MAYIAEARISINGTRLTEGQSMTVRVAMESFATSLRSDGLGDDAHGKAMTAAYLARYTEIARLIYRKT